MICYSFHFICLVGLGIVVKNMSELQILDTLFSKLLSKSLAKSWKHSFLFSIGILLSCECFKRHWIQIMLFDGTWQHQERPYQHCREEMLLSYHLRSSSITPSSFVQGGKVYNQKGGDLICNLDQLVALVTFLPFSTISPCGKQT